MKKIVLFSIFFNFSHFYSQKIIGNVNLPIEKFSSKSLDESLNNFYYNLKFVSNTSEPQNKKEALYILQIGEKYSKFTELNNLKLDSLRKSFNSLATTGSKEMNEMLKFKVQSKLVIVKNKDSLINTFQNTIIHTYQYTDQQPSLKWKLENNTK